MHLVYLDESGNTGVNLADADQPVFVLCALVVAEHQWQSLEAGLQQVLDTRMPNWRSNEKFEIHGADLRTGKGWFAGKSVAQRIAFRDEWMQMGVRHGCRLIYRGINKKSYSSWLVKTFGQGVVVHPYVAAFALLSRCIDNYLASLPMPAMGVLIADENKEIVADIEKSIVVLRGATGPLRLGRIIEKGFFIESHKSLPLQLCDLFALSFRKNVESKIPGSNKAVKPIDASGIALAESIVYADNQHDSDVLGWLEQQGKSAKKQRPGDKPRVD